MGWIEFVSGFECLSVHNIHFVECVSVCVRVSVCLSISLSVCLTCLSHERPSPPPLRHVDYAGLISSDVLSNLTLIHCSKPCPNTSQHKHHCHQLQG